MVFKDVIKLFEDYRDFKGGQVRFFGYDFSGADGVRIKISLLGRNYALAKEAWRVVNVFLSGVGEVRSDFGDAKRCSITHEVKFLHAGNHGYCVAFTGGFDDVPFTLDAIRRFSNCYVLASLIEVFETE
ncbi:hypothetical protein I9018_24755 [Pseudomonas sp. MPFS]|uniref:hypothetical protein n=1 Tax=Pseudomonas sp. MPFS TaxID=2795724 RepID=UPI001F12CF5D|nr:hypothetical protein [Pseudomonas sp. MPFS]UMZ10668.1 hypothetical protein I9018_24755 [Pseudomonas sp. MPFS]